MSSLAAIRCVAPTKSVFGSIYLQCHVKPGASKQREGITSVSNDRIEVCVSARAKEGEANKATREVFSAILKCPRSDVEVIRGFKCRDKTIAIYGIDIKGSEERCISRIRAQLEAAVD